MSTTALSLARTQLAEANGSGAPARPLVVASWQRSLEHHVDREHLNPPFQPDPDLDSPLVHAATPILDSLHEQLSTESVSMMLTDSTGVVLSRRLTHPGLTTRLNRVKLAPGHSFAEEAVGTNGIGTALASRGPVSIEGSEHFNESLRGFHCAAVPILHPTRRTLLGTFNLTTLAQGAGSMALALATLTAGQIERELARVSSAREFRLFGRYLDACHRLLRTPVLAFNNECLMMNDRLRAQMSGADHGTLVAFARDSVRGRSANRTVTLPSGMLVEVREINDHEAHDSGHVLSVHLVGAARRMASTPVPRQIPGLIGADPVWLKAVATVQSGHARRSVIGVFGEPGVGKVHLLSAVHRNRDGANPIVLEPPTEDDVLIEAQWLDALAEAMRDEGGLVILRNTQWMSPRLRTAVVDALVGADAGRSARVALTANPDAIAPEDELVALCATRVELPPVRHRHTDLLALAKHFLRMHLPRGDHQLTPAAQSALTRMAWPENARQIESVMRATARRAISADRIDVADLPADCLTSGPVLSPLESIERDAIVQGLIDRNCNVGRTARELGIARATMYRKMRRYGIDPAAL